MTTSVIRTCIIYILLVLAIRLTGKRQIGELEISELVSTILISEIAAAPVSNQDVPLSFAIIPILLIISLEVIISFLATRSNIMKKIFLGSPSVLIKRGEVQPKELSKARMSLEELLCELRVCGINTIEDVDYAILESNGKLSVTPKAHARTVTNADIKLKADETGIAHAVVIDGTIKKEALEGSGKDRGWLDQEIKKAKLKLEDIFLLSIDDADNIYIIKRKDVE
ncbi:MAG: DUF421 domain-containing protein [Clostridia bacterium]|nr:DUF421 domain-containing protein [Clostridia bacterium]